ncbi:MAG: hypothetical protein JWM68_3622 [Verrucomicrobiales bacterium]|nr:hypothetical protein [Verrucomicrobiales bacterium]
MKCLRALCLRFSVPIASLTVVAGGNLCATTETNLLAYHIYMGNTHAHTALTWSHGDQFEKGKGAADGESKNMKLVIAPDGVQSAPKGKVVRTDWQKHQGPPAKHYALAKANGYDFYVTSDHSQEVAFSPASPTNAAWAATKREAVEATDSNFVALAGYEHSENNGPGGTGHLNVINSSEYLNAMRKGVDLPTLYKWLKTVKPNGAGPVVAVFNHPGPRQYADWGNCDPEIMDIITMFELINSNTSLHAGAFVIALDKGWKVSPVCGNDNHGFWGISNHTSRTGVLATDRTKVAILEAMKNRRTYASLDRNLQCRYSVNGAIMGSTLDKTNAFQFEIMISDPDSNEPKDKITRIEIVKDGGAVVETFKPSPAYNVTWKPLILDATNRYFFVRVWNAGGADAAKAKPADPVAWLAPVWTGR